MDRIKLARESLKNHIEYDKKAAGMQTGIINIGIAEAETILELLAEKDPLPAELEGGGSTWWYVCGDCHGEININDHYCRHCGRGVTWT